MAKDYDHDYRRGRNKREDDDEPHYRDQGGGDEEPYYRGYGSERSRYIHGSGGPGDRGSYYSGPHRRAYRGRGYGEPYGAYDYDRYESGDRPREPYYRRGYESEYHEPYWRPAEEKPRGIHAGRGPRGYQRSDERIREDINDRLTDDGYVDATDIEVVVNNSLVTLTGRVGSREEKRRAEDIADSVSGVTDVSNQLRVGQSVPITSEPDTEFPPRSRTAGI
jgi:hypothetical protein